MTSRAFAGSGPPRAQPASHRTHRREPAPRPRQTIQNCLTCDPARGRNSLGQQARRPGRDHLVTGGRHHPGIPGRNHPVTDGRLHRNRHAKGAGVLVRALHGLGGIGKSRLAVEYAWKHEAEYSALLFVRAESAAALNANLAALVGAFLLDLPEKGAREDAAKIEAVLRWLEASPTWLLIL